MNQFYSDYLYAAWRFDMWVKGYGSYVDIERQVEAGELVSGKDYPDLHKGSE
jgi:hypothetical protein